MRFRILGHLEVLTPDGWTSISAPKWRSLLACLLVRPGQLVPTDSLIFELWGDNPPSTANNMVSIYVHRLRKEVIGDADGQTLVHRAPGYLLRVGPGDLDSQVFESLVAEGRSAMAAAQPERAAELLAEALRLWRGPLLADVPPSPLLAAHANRAAERCLDTTELRIEADLACGRAAQVVAELRGLVAEHPLRERLRALLMRALEEAGRRAEAFEAYAQARQVISDELGVEPGSELQRLYAQLLAADASSAAMPGSSALPRTRQRRTHATPVGPDRQGAAGEAVGRADDPGATAAAGASASSSQAVEAGLGGSAVDDAGAVRTWADAPGSIAIGTIVDPGPVDPVPTATAVASGVSEGAPGSAPPIPGPAQLPADIGDFTGRETPVAQLCALLLGTDATSSPGAVRIAVVNGAGGLGKTTLAVHAAHRVRAQFPDGQLYVDLLGASGQPAAPGEVLARFLRDLGVEGDKVPARDDERGALYRTRLAGGSSSCWTMPRTRLRSARCCRAARRAPSW